MVAFVHRTRLAASLTLLALTVRVPLALAINEGCVANGTELTCPLQIGWYQYSVTNPQAYVRLTNYTGQYVQINWIGATPVVGGYWSEMCTFLDAYITAQSSPGVGEVGCVSKEPWESAYPSLGWDGYHTALSVPTWSNLFLAGNVHITPSVSDYQHTFTVVSYPQSAGVYSWRQPQADAVIACNGSTQWTAWSPWQNTAGHNLAISGPRSSRRVQAISTSWMARASTSSTCTAACAGPTVASTSEGACSSGVKRWRRASGSPAR